MYQTSDYDIKKYIKEQWYMVVWGDYTQLTAWTKEEADNQYKLRNTPNVPLVIYNPDGTIYRTRYTDKIPGWDPTLRWGTKTPKEADKMLGRGGQDNEKNFKRYFKLF